MKRRCLSIFLVITILCFTTFAYASNLTDLKNQLSKNENEIDKKQDEIKKIETQQKDLLEDIDLLSKEIGTLESEIEKLNLQIKDLSTDIEAKEHQLAQKMEELEKQEELFKKRVVAMYRTGNVSTLDVLLSSDNIFDFLSRNEMMNKIAEYDKSILDKINEQKEQIENIKLQLEASKQAIEKDKEETESKSDTLTVSKNKLNARNSELESNKDALSRSIDKLNAESEKLESEIRNLQSGGTSYTGGQMAWPLPGFSTITSPYGMRLHPTLKVYKLHTGVDIAGSGCNGKPIVAANAGTVITAKWNSAYGNMIIVDHGGGITTLYAHASKLAVSTGTKVKRGQTIAYVGTTGYSTGPHLHFEVRINGSTTNPLAYIK